MPIYEYRCKKGHTFELMQPIMADSLDKCQVCGAPAERVLFAPAVHFKGSGFYNTDYGTKKRSRELKASAESGADKTDSKSNEKSESKGDSSGNSKSDTGGDSKPAKTAEKSASKSGD